MNRAEMGYKKASGRLILLKPIFIVEINIYCNHRQPPIRCRGLYVYHCTLSLKCLLPLASVWSKTILNTGGVGGTGADPQA